MVSILILLAVFAVLFNLDMLIRKLRPYTRITYCELRNSQKDLFGHSRGCGNPDF